MGRRHHSIIGGTVFEGIRRSAEQKELEPAPPRARWKEKEPKSFKNHPESNAGTPENEDAQKNNESREEVLQRILMNRISRRVEEKYGINAIVSAQELSKIRTEELPLAIVELHHETEINAEVSKRLPGIEEPRTVFNIREAVIREIHNRITSHT